MPRKHRETLGIHRGHLTHPQCHKATGDAEASQGSSLHNRRTQHQCLKEKKLFVSRLHSCPVKRPVSNSYLSPAACSALRHHRPSCRLQVSGFNPVSEYRDCIAVNENDLLVVAARLLPCAVHSGIIGLHVSFKQAVLNPVSDGLYSIYRITHGR